MQHPTISIVEILPLDAGRFGILLISKRVNGRRELEENVFAVCKGIQTSFKEQTGRTVSIYVSRPFGKLSEFSDLFKEHEHSLRKAPLLGRNKIMHPHDLLVSTKPAEELPPACFAPLERCLEAGDGKLLNSTIEEIFQKLSNPFNEEELRNICRELLRILDKFRLRHDLPSMEMFMAEGQLHSESWYTKQGICDWFIQMYSEALNEAQNRTFAPYSRKIRQTLEFIHTRYSDDLTTESLSEKLGISGDHLRHLFKEETGQTILDYLTNVRIEKAREFLAGGQYKIYEVASRVGYQSSQYFSQVFRKKTGIKPLDYIDSKSKGKGSYENEN
ncbi:MAG: helix-turn-helix protein [Paenibacillus sp.]|nr:helix-turn-helix protein [Paenibacillus sp.]